MSDSDNVKAAGRWVSGQFFAYLLSFMFGVGGTLTAIKTGLFAVGSDVDALREEVSDGFHAVEHRLDGTEDALKGISVNSNKIEEAKSEIASLKSKLDVERTRIESRIETTRVALVAKHDLGVQRIGLMQAHLEQVADGVKTEVLDARQASTESTEELARRIDKLLEEDEAIRNGFVAELSRLVESGRLAIGKRNFPEIGRWIARSSYFVRSLAIPTETGWLRDVSIVKKDLREATGKFEKETDETTKLAHARRVLVIVQTVRDLAQGGQLQ